MTVKKLVLAQVTSLDAMIAEGQKGPPGLVATWAKKELQPLLKKLKFTFDTEISGTYPLIVQFRRKGCTDVEAKAVVDVLSKTFKIPFQTGVQNTYSPFVKLSRRFTPFPGVFGYFVVTLGHNGSLAVKFTM